MNNQNPPPNSDNENRDDDSMTSGEYEAFFDSTISLVDDNDGPEPTPNTQVIPEIPSVLNNPVPDVPEVQHIFLPDPYLDDNFLPTTISPQLLEFQVVPLSIDLVHNPRSRGRPAAMDGNPRRRYICSFPGCVCSFTRNEHLRRHMFIHIRRESHQCPRCGSIFTRRDNMLTHIRRMHLN